MIKLSLVLGTALSVLLPVAIAAPAQAQTAYIPASTSYGCDYVDGMLCYDALENSDKIISMFVTYYGDWYMLAIQEYDLHNMFYVVNGDGDIVAQMMTDDNLRGLPYYRGELMSDGNLDLIGTFSSEFNLLWENRNWL